MFQTGNIVSLIVHKWVWNVFKVSNSCLMDLGCPLLGESSDRRLRRRAATISTTRISGHKVCWSGNVAGKMNGLVVHGFPSKVRHSIFRQLGLPVLEFWQKIEREINEGLLNSFFKMLNLWQFPKKDTSYTGNCTRSLLIWKLDLRSKTFSW